MPVLGENLSWIQQAVFVFADLDDLPVLNHDLTPTVLQAFFGKRCDALRVED